MTSSKNFKKEKVNFTVQTKSTETFNQSKHNNLASPSKLSGQANFRDLGEFSNKKTVVQTRLNSHNTSITTDVA